MLYLNKSPIQLKRMCAYINLVPLFVCVFSFFFLFICIKDNLSLMINAEEVHKILVTNLIQYLFIKPFK